MPAEQSTPTEQADQSIEQPAQTVLPRVEERPPPERHQPRCIAVQLLEVKRPLAFRRPHLHSGDETTEVLVSLLTRNQHW